MSSSLKEVTLPLMGEGITEATFIKWLKNPGDFVEKDDALFEVSTDKVDTEVVSPESGYLIKTYADSDQVIAVHGIVAYLSEDKSALAPEKVDNQVEAKLEKSSPKSSSTTRPISMSRSTQESVSHETSSVKSSPLARRMAKELRLNIDAIQGSGLGGKVSKQDVLSFIEDVLAQADIQLPKEPLLDTLQTKKVGDLETLDGVPVRREKMTKMRRLTAEHMVQSVRTSPHVTTTFEINMHAVSESRKNLRDDLMSQHNLKLTFTHYLAYAAIQAIKQHPIVNVSVDGDDILWRDDINFGLAVAIDSGLIVPVIKKTQSMSFLEFIQATQDIITRARAGKLQPDEVKGGSFSLTNPGLFGSLHSNPIINQPQVAILNVGAVVQRPVVESGEITIAPMMHAGLTFDHRVIDGEGGAKYLASFKEILEKADFTLV